MLGLFWKKTTNNAAIWGALLSIVFALAFKAGCNCGLLAPMPWMRQIEFTFLLTVLVMITFSLIEGKGKDHQKAVQITKSLFKTDLVFNIAAMAIILILTVIYSVFW